MIDKMKALYAKLEELYLLPQTADTDTKVSIIHNQILVLDLIIKTKSVS